MQNPAWRDVLTGEAIEPGPVEPVPLTSPEQGMPPSAADLASETIQSQQVCRNCMVREVAIQDPLKPPANDGHGFVPSLKELLTDRGHRCPHTLLGRQSHDLELSLLVRSTTMREPQEVERLRSALPPLAPTLGRVSAKLDQARFVGMQSQSELAEPFPERLQKHPRRPHVLKAHYTIVRVAKHDDLPSPWLFAPVLNPQIESVMQVDVCQEWRDHRTLRSSLYSRHPPSVFDHTRFEPFTNQSSNPLIGNPVFEEPEHPPVIDFVEERADVGIHNPVHLSALDSSP
jgi:hypothetical protein